MYTGIDHVAQGSAVVWTERQLKSNCLILQQRKDRQTRSPLYRVNHPHRHIRLTLPISESLSNKQCRHLLCVSSWAVGRYSRLASYIRSTCVRSCVRAFRVSVWVVHLERCESLCGGTGVADNFK